MIIWLMGPKYEDLTEIAQELQSGVDAVILYHHEIEGYQVMAPVAAFLSMQTDVIVCGDADTIDIRHTISDICNPMWVHVKRSDKGDFEEPEPVKDVFMVERDTITLKECVRRIRYNSEYTAQDPFCMVIVRYFSTLTDKLIAQIRKLIDEKNPVLLAVQDGRKDDQHRCAVMDRVKMLKREFGTSVKIITIPRVKEIVNMQDD